MRASYTSHYRKGLIQLLDVLEFRSSNRTHRPMIATLKLIGRYARGPVQYYPDGEDVPAQRGLGGDWADLVVKVDQRDRRRICDRVGEHLQGGRWVLASTFPGWCRSRAFRRCS